MKSNQAKNENTEGIRVLTTGNCQSVSGKAELSYEIGCDKDKSLHVRIVANSGGGLFSKQWKELTSIESLLNSGKPINAVLMHTPKQSANNAGFILAILAYLGLIKVVSENPRNARERYLTADETRRLYAELEKSDNPQLKYIISLLLLLGCRKRELLDARWQDFDLERRSWRIPMSKTGKARHVPLSQAALSVLAQLPRWEKCPYVVPNPKTLQPYTCVFRSWNTARKAAGLPEVRVHDIRHSAASYLINSGRSIYEVAKVLGHSQIKTTSRYAHLSQETLLAAVDAAADATGIDWGKPQEARQE